MRELKEDYDKCIADGFIISLHGKVNEEKVRKMLMLVDGNKEVAQKSAKEADKNSVTWNKKCARTGTASTITASLLPIRTSKKLKFNLTFTPMF